MAFKDIDLSFNKVYNGLGILDGDDAIIQLVNDCVKTRIGEVLYNPALGSTTLDYTQGTRNIMTLSLLRDEIYFALINESEIRCSKSNIEVSIDDVNKRFVVKIDFLIRNESKVISTNLIFNYNK